MIRILRDFKPILDLDLYGERMPEERITGSKVDLDLSAGLTYTSVYKVGLFAVTFQMSLIITKLNVCLHVATETGRYMNHLYVINLRMQGK